MIIATTREDPAVETRVAVTPETVKRLAGLGALVRVEAGAGLASGFTDADYQAAGATIAASASQALSGADIVLKVRRPSAAELAHIQKSALVIAIMDPYGHADALNAMAAAGVSSFAMELMPRITRAQVMDVLSSQANLAGYRAVIDASAEYGRALPMMMTAAGTVPAARIFIMGAGVAGLQAVATARRLGAVVTATDVRPAAKEQVESLGAKFIEVAYETDEEKEAAEGVGGYARPMPQSWLDRQKLEVAKRVAQADIVISTALIPGRPAPVLITEEMVKSMKPGSVIVDLAAANGGNCPLTEAGKTVVKHGVTIVGETNLPAMVAADASALYARNVLDFLKLVIDKEGQFHVPMDDDIVAACLMTRAGQVLRK